MTENHKARIEEIIQNGYDFKFGDYISRGFEILQKELGMFILYSVVFFAISFICQLIPLIGPLANSFILQPALIVGAFIAAHEVYKGNRFEFGIFFRGFEYLGQLALIVLVTSLIFLVCFIPFGVMALGSGVFEWFVEIMENPIAIEEGLPVFTPMLIVSFAFSFLLSIYFVIAYGWANLFVVFYNMSFWDAMEASRKLITKQWFMFLLFAIVMLIILILGVLLLCVGILAAIPATFCMQYAAFEDITKLNQEPGEGAFIDQHLIVS